MEDTKKHAYCWLWGWEKPSPLRTLTRRFMRQLSVMMVMGAWGCPRVGCHPIGLIFFMSSLEGLPSHCPIKGRPYYYDGTGFRPLTACVCWFGARGEIVTTLLAICHWKIVGTRALPSRDHNKEERERINPSLLLSITVTVIEKKGRIVKRDDQEVIDYDKAWVRAAFLLDGKS